MALLRIPVTLPTWEELNRRVSWWSGSINEFFDTHVGTDTTDHDGIYARLDSSNTFVETPQIIKSPSTTGRPGLALHDSNGDIVSEYYYNETGSEDRVNLLTYDGRALYLNNGAVGGVVCGAHTQVIDSGTNTITAKEVYEMLNSTTSTRVYSRANRLPSGQITLTANQATTSKSHSAVASDSVISFMPETSTAASAIPTMYVSTRVANSFTVTHSNNAKTTRTFSYFIHG